MYYRPYLIPSTCEFYYIIGQKTLKFKFKMSQMGQYFVFLCFGVFFCFLEN